MIQYKGVLLVVFIIVIVAGGSFLLFGPYGKDLPDIINHPRDFILGVSNSDDETSGADGGIGSGDGGDGSGSGSGGSSGGGSSEIVLNSGECLMRQISYSLREFKEDFECNGYNGTSCISMSANCSMEIYNLDDSPSTGNFEVVYSLLNGNQNILGIDSFNQSIGIGQNALFLASFNLQNQSGIDENLDCSFDVKNIPKKEICG